MPPFFLPHRAIHLKEMMDDPHCDPVKLHNTYTQFERGNQLFAAWGRVYAYYLRPLMKRSHTYTLLDIGCGGGDIPRQLMAWASGDERHLSVTAIDPDVRALDFASSQKAPANLEFRAAMTGDLVAKGEQFDFVISNHVLHHLSDEELEELCQHSAQLCRRRVIHNDIQRGDLAYAFFWALTKPVFHNSFTTPDGLTSIKRSYTTRELREIALPGWRVETMFPYRNLLMYDV